MCMHACVYIVCAFPCLHPSYPSLKSTSQASAWDASKKLRANMCCPHHPPPLPNPISVSYTSARSYAILLGPSASVDELVRQAEAVVTTAVAACDTDASGSRTPDLAAIEAASPAQRAGWVMSLCGATHATERLQQLAEGLVLPAMALRWVWLRWSAKNAVMIDGIGTWLQRRTSLCLRGS